MIESEVVLLLLHFKILIQGHLFTRFVQKMTRPVKNYKSIINVKVEEFGVGFGFPMWVLLTVYYLNIMYIKFSMWVMQLFNFMFKDV